MKAKILIFMLVLAALVATYYLPSSQNEARVVENIEPKEVDIEPKEVEPFKSKEDCYEAAEQYRAKCTNKNGPCAVFEVYCDARGCC